MRRLIGPRLWVIATIMLAACHKPVSPDVEQNRRFRQVLLEELRPITLENCSFKRFGSANDGGYVMCENLNRNVESAYSYGIGGNDDWGCEISSTYRVPVHQYDCFNPPLLACKAGQFVPHAECVGPKTEVIDARATQSAIRSRRTEMTASG